MTPRPTPPPTRLSPTQIALRIRRETAINAGRAAERAYCESEREWRTTQEESELDAA